MNAFSKLKYDLAYGMADQLAALYESAPAQVFIEALESSPYKIYGYNENLSTACCGMNQTEQDNHVVGFGNKGYLILVMKGNDNG